MHFIKIFLQALDKHLNIVSLDVPYPVNYGGVFDLFYKLVALHKAGIKIHLHCFEYGRGEQPELNKYCVEVNYHQRKTGYKGFSPKLPYIVASRISNVLNEKLLENDYPILLEGIHCTGILLDDRFKNRKIVVRLHNVEHQYYKQLYYNTRAAFKKLYYLHESKLLKEYERNIASKASLILAVAENDVETYKQDFEINNIVYLPVFLPFEKVASQEGAGSFCLYHGNLSVAENEKAVTWLLKNVFSKLQIPFVIAGKNPSAKLLSLAKQLHVKIIANPSSAHMQQLITDAQIHLLPSFNTTGIKLKLLNALFNGRHCIVNNAAVNNTGLESVCTTATDAEDFRNKILKLYQQPFTVTDIQARKNVLEKIYNNTANAEKLIPLIW